MSSRLRTAAVIAAAAGVVGLAQQPAPQTPLSAEARWLRAGDAWSAGHYPDALNDLIALMKSPAASDYLDRVALLTGEVFVTTELTTDGRNPHISATGKYASYETGAGAATVTRVVKLGGAAPQTIVDLKGTLVTFDPTDTKIAFVRPVPGVPGSEIVVRDLASGSETVWTSNGLSKTALQWLGDGKSLIFAGGDDVAPTNDVYLVHSDLSVARLTETPEMKVGVTIDPRGATIVYAAGRAGGAPGRGAGGGGGGGGGRAGGGVPAPTTYTVYQVASKASRTITGSQLTMSADGSTLAWITRGADGSYTLNTSPAGNDSVTIARTTAGIQRIDAPALSPDGSLVAYQFMASVGSSTDWEIYVTDRTGAHRRITRDIQHDILPKFLTNNLLLGLIGEPRHRRSYVYDVTAGTRTRVFANNTIRTISPEYVWLPSDDGQHLIIQAERDGDTVSAERGVYVTDLNRKITTAQLLARLNDQLAVENDLRQRMTKAFQPVSDQVRRIVSKISPYRAYTYEKTLYDFDSKYVTQPGNAKAIDYLNKTYTSFGYTPEIQWFTPSGRGGAPAAPGAAPAQPRTANVVATLKGTENPDLVYVVSSHFDSVAVGPGADDDTSGTSALLEAARALADTPMPATIVFASFTGEEAGLLGSREFVRLAAERKWNIVGALNNDMIGWAGESTRMDNTIRYSNAGIRDIQHGAAFLFTDLVLYDAKYYKGTDAAAFYDGWGDIVGGIGSYPVLSNPNYHQPSDLIETIDLRQVAETAKVTAATLVYLASSPSRLKGLTATKTATGTDVSWTPSLEAGVRTYIVAYGPPADPMKTRITVTTAKATLPALSAGTQIAVKAVNARGLEGWDWARVAVQ